MKKRPYRIFCAWLLLVCFVAGQYMVYVHQHNILQKAYTANASKHQHKPAATLQEKCYMCDAMHNNAAVLAQTVQYFPATVKQHIYQPGDHNFIFIALVLSSGRAPPADPLSC